MRSRLLASVGVLATVIAVVWLGVVSLAPVRVAGQPSLASVGWVAEASSEGAQAQTAASDTLTLPRTPWGHPDLQGIWNNSTNTPSRQRIEAGHPGIREPAVPIVPPAPPR